MALEMASNSRAVVVGGSKGLGLDIVKALADKGCQVVVLSRSEGGIGSLIERYGKQVQSVPTDIGDPNSVRKAFETVAAELGGVDYLILNAALAMPSELTEIDDSSLQQQLLVNMAGPICCLREAQPLMQNGIAVFISSESVNFPFPMLALYAAVKAGMETFIKGIRGEFYQKGRNRLVTFRCGSMAGTAFGEGWGEALTQKFFAVASERGHLGKTGGPMNTADVADAVVQVLATPAGANIDLIEYRSSSAN